MTSPSPWNTDTLTRRLDAVGSSLGELRRRETALWKRLGAIRIVQERLDAELVRRLWLRALRAVVRCLPPSRRWWFWWRRALKGTPKK